MTIGKRRSEKAGDLRGVKKNPEVTKNRTATSSAESELGAFNRFIWDVVSINSHIEDIHEEWAQRLGLTGPQWLILMAIRELDTGGGVSGVDIATKLHFHQAFVTPQTKILEKADYISRSTSKADARFVLMALTAKAQRDIEGLEALRRQVNAMMFSGLDETAVQSILELLSQLRLNSERAARQLAVDNLGR